jgi:hypothetical protein
VGGEEIRMSRRDDVERFEHAGFLVRINQDDQTDSPDDWGDEACFLSELKHQNFRAFGRKGWDAYEAKNSIPWGDFPWNWKENSDWLMDEFGGEDEAKEHWEKAYDPAWEVYPVQLHDYGSNGSSLHMCDYEEAHAFIFVRVPATAAEKLAALDEDGPFRGFVDPDKAARALIEDWDNYLSGNVWWIVVEQKVTCPTCEHDEYKHVDSTGGVYGDLTEAIKVGKEMAEACAPSAVKESAG